MLTITGIVLFYLVLVLGLALIPLGFPGTWIMVAAAILFAILGDLNPAGSEIVAVVIAALLAGLGEAIEFGVRVLGSKLAKVPNGAIVCAIIGGIVGAIVGVPVFLVGSLLGLLIGVFLGAFVYALVTTHDIAAAISMSIATTTSQVVALFAKTCIGLAIIIYLTVVLF